VHPLGTCMTIKVSLGTRGFREAMELSQRLGYRAKLLCHFGQAGWQPARPQAAILANNVA